MTASSTNTIYALSTAPGRAAIAVIRISGPAAGTVLTTLTARPAPPPARQATLATLRHPVTRAPLDQALILYFEGPASETGEDLAELQIHGGRAVIAAVLDVIGQIPGCRPAEPGEFAHRAFINGKMDLTAAEGLADLIDAETEAQRRQAVTLATGAHAKLYDGWRTRLIEAQALTESAIDFSDEGDVSETAITMARGRVRDLHAEITSHLSGAHRGEIVRDGFRVVIAGPPNAGKSTLLNALAKRDAAIVSEEAGTTRDTIEVHLDLAGLAVIVTDTAGIRETDASIEREGIRRTYAQAERANLLIWLSDATNPIALPNDLAEIGADRLIVASKVDQLDVGRSSSSDVANLAISAQTGTGLDLLTDQIIERAQSQVGNNMDIVPTSARQTHLLKRTAEQLQIHLTNDPIHIELRAEDLRIAADSLGRLTGRVDPEDVLDQIFSRFCIGK